MIEIRHRESGASLLRLEGESLAGRSLRGVNLVGAELRGRSLVGADLEEAHLELADLEEVDGREAALRDAHLFCADLARADLDGARLQGANLSQARLPGARLRSADLQGASLRGASLREASLVDAVLNGADLTGADLTAADLTRAHLAGTRLEGANLTGAILAGISLRQATYDRRTSWPAGFDPQSYTRLDAGSAAAGSLAPESDRHGARPPVIEVREARAAGEEGNLGAAPSGTTSGPTIPGVEIGRSQTFINGRRTLVISHDRQTPPGTLGYTVVIRPGCSVGDHYHHRRSERITLLHGRLTVVLQDHRPASGAQGLANAFALDYPGLCLTIPPGVAHSLAAQEGLAVLHVLASSEYDPGDDVRVALPRL